MARKLLGVVRHHLLCLRGLHLVETLRPSLDGQEGAVHGMAAHEAPPVLHDRGLGLLLESSLSRAHDLETLQREGGILLDAGGDLGLGEEGVKVRHEKNSWEKGRAKLPGVLSDTRQLSRLPAAVAWLYNFAINIIQNMQIPSEHLSWRRVSPIYSVLTELGPHQRSRTPVQGSGTHSRSVIPQVMTHLFFPVMVIDRRLFAV